MVNERTPYAYNRAHYGELIREARLKRGLTQRELADRLNVAKNYVSNWEAGRARPDLNLVPALCVALGISLPQFFGEKSDMDALSSEEKRHVRCYRRLSPENRGAVDGLMDTMLRMAEDALRERAKRYRPLPMHELRASAGTGNPLDDGGRTERVYVLRDAVYARTDCLIRVAGDSMEPDFFDGDSLQVQYAQQVAPGEIGIFIADGEGYVKEYREDGLHSHNPKYPVLHFGEDDGVRCVGRVLGVLRETEKAPAEIAELLCEDSIER